MPNVCMQALGGLLLLGYLIGAFGQAFPGMSGSTPSSAASGSSSSSGPQLYSYDLIDTYPHDPDAFTQGLDYDKVDGQDVFWESTGTAFQMRIPSCICWLDAFTTVYSISVVSLSGLIGDVLQATTRGGSVTVHTDF